jgi:hypothetical protein
VLTDVRNRGAQRLARGECHLKDSVNAISFKVCRMVSDSVCTMHATICIIAMQDEPLRCYSKAQPIVFITISWNTREKPDNDKGRTPINPPHLLRAHLPSTWWLVLVVLVEIGGKSWLSYESGAVFPSVLLPHSHGPFTLFTLRAIPEKRCSCV